MVAPWRMAARLVTGPVAFGLGGVIDSAAYLMGAARARLRSRFARRRAGS